MSVLELTYIHNSKLLDVISYNIAGLQIAFIDVLITYQNVKMLYH